MIFLDVSCLELSTWLLIMPKAGVDRGRTLKETTNGKARPRRITVVGFPFGFPDQISGLVVYPASDDLS
jgi:hypothetical protein